MLLQEFREQYREALLQFLWGQWTSLGVAGQVVTTDTRVIDPEALFLFTTSMGRQDQRLFDEMLDWLNLHDRFLNVQRIKTMHKSENLGEAAVISAVATVLGSRNKSIKWKTLGNLVSSNELAKKDSLFFLRNCQPMPVLGDADSTFKAFGLLRNPIVGRNLSRTFSTKNAQTLLLQLRSLLGVNSRSEIMCYLLLHSEGKIPRIAEECYYSWRSVQDSLFEMGHSGCLNFTASKKTRSYYLNHEHWFRVLGRSQEEGATWFCWAPLYAGLERLWKYLQDPALLNMDQAAFIGDLRYFLTVTQRDIFDRAGFGRFFRDLDAMSEGDFLQGLLGRIQGMLGV